MVLFANLVVVALLVLLIKLDGVAICKELAVKLLQGVLPKALVLICHIA